MSVNNFIGFALVRLRRISFGTPTGRDFDRAVGLSGFSFRSAPLRTRPTSLTTNVGFLVADGDIGTPTYD
ncbi:MAG: hypothetical protein ABIJ45_11420 [Candidatus Zixiibacteriota bacterium]